MKRIVQAVMVLIRKLIEFHTRFKAWKPIHLCWWFEKHGLPIPPYLIGASAHFEQGYWAIAPDDPSTVDDPSSCSFNKYPYEETVMVGDIRHLRIDFGETGGANAKGNLQLWTNNTNDFSTATQVTTSSSPVSIVPDVNNMLTDAIRTTTSVCVNAIQATVIDGYYIDASDESPKLDFGGCQAEMQFCIQWDDTATHKEYHYFFLALDGTGFDEIHDVIVIQSLKPVTLSLNDVVSDSETTMLSGGELLAKYIYSQVVDLSSAVSLAAVIPANYQITDIACQNIDLSVEVSSEALNVSLHHLFPQNTASSSKVQELSGRIGWLEVIAPQSVESGIPQIKPISLTGRPTFQRMTGKKIAVGGGPAGANPTHVYAIREDGGVDAAGDDTNGQVSGARQWTNIKVISAGEQHVVGLKYDGTVVAAGRDNENQLNVGGWDDVIGLDAYYDGTLGVMPLGYDRWGDESYDRNTYDTNLYLFDNVYSWQNVVDLAFGTNHCVCAHSDGTCHFYAFNASDGQADVDSWTNIIQIVAGKLHTIGLKSDGTVIATGNDDYGQVSGVNGLTGVQGVEAGRYVSVVLYDDGTLEAFGDDTLNVVSGINAWVGTFRGVDVGYGCAIALPLSGREIYTCGDYAPDTSNFFTVNIFPTTIASETETSYMSRWPTTWSLGSVPVAVETGIADLNLTRFIELITVQPSFVSSSPAFKNVKIERFVNLAEISFVQVRSASSLDLISCSLKRNLFPDSLSSGSEVTGSQTRTNLAKLCFANVASQAQCTRSFMWGGRSGRGLLMRCTNSKLTQGGQDFDGSETTLIFAVRPDGKVESIQDGVDATNSDVWETPREQWTNAAKISAGHMHVVAVRADGYSMVVGDDTYGQVTDMDSWSGGVAGIACGYEQTLGLIVDGTVNVAGRDDYGQLSCVSTWTDIFDLDVGKCHSLGCKTDGTAVACGADSGEDADLGQCDVSTWSDIVQVAAGNFFSAGLGSDGTVVVAGQFAGDPSGWTDIIEICAYNETLLGIDSSFNIHAEGDASTRTEISCVQSNWTGQFIRAAAGNVHTLGMTLDRSLKLCGNVLSDPDVDHWFNARIWPLALSASSEVSNMHSNALLQLYELGISSVSAESLITQAAVSAARTVMFSGVTSASEIVNIAIGALKDVGFDDMASQTEVVNVVFSVLRQLHLPKVELSSGVLAAVVNAVRIARQSNLQSAAQVTDLVLRTVSFKGLYSGNVAAQAQISGLAMSLLRTLQVAGPTSDSTIIEPLMNVRRLLAVEDPGIDSSVLDAYLGVIRKLIVYDAAAPSQVTAPLVYATRALMGLEAQVDSQVLEATLIAVRNLQEAKLKSAAIVAQAFAQAIRNFHLEGLALSSEVVNAAMVAVRQVQAQGPSTVASISDAILQAVRDVAPDGLTVDSEVAHVHYSLLRHLLLNDTSSPVEVTNTTFDIFGKAFTRPDDVKTAAQVTTLAVSLLRSALVAQSVTAGAEVKDGRLGPIRLIGSSEVDAASEVTALAIQSALLLHIEGPLVPARAENVALSLIRALELNEIAASSEVVDGLLQAIRHTPLQPLLAESSLGSPYMELIQGLRGENLTLNTQIQNVLVEASTLFRLYEVDCDTTISRTIIEMKRGLFTRIIQSESQITDMNVELASVGQNGHININFYGKTPTVIYSGEKPEIDKEGCIPEIYFKA